MVEERENDHRGEMAIGREREEKNTEKEKGGEKEREMERKDMCLS